MTYPGCPPFFCGGWWWWIPLCKGYGQHILSSANKVVQVFDLLKYIYQFLLFPLTTNDLHKNRDLTILAIIKIVIIFSEEKL